MPFTFAHPAAVLPLRRVLWLPGLVAGSLAPDVAYYVPVGDFGHDPLGVVTVDVVVGFALVALWWAAAPAVELVVRRQVRVRRAGVLKAVASVVVGAATHVAWDAVTHFDGAAVRAWEWLRAPVVEPHKLFNVIAYISAVVGTAVVAWAAVRWAKQAKAVAPQQWARWARWAVLGALAAGAVAAVVASDPVGVVYDQVRTVLIAAVRGAGVAAAVVVAAVWAAKLRGRREDSPLSPGSSHRD